MSCVLYFLYGYFLWKILVTSKGCECAAILTVMSKVFILVSELKFVYSATWISILFPNIFAKNELVMEL